MIVCSLLLIANLLLIALPNMSSKSSIVKNNVSTSTIDTVLKQKSAKSDLKWRILPSRTSIVFKVKHFVLMEVEGKFNDVEGYLETKTSGNFADSKVSVEIPVASITTGNIDRDTHLKTDDFFDVEKHPKMTFQSTKITDNSDGTYKMVGNLTIRNVSKPVVLSVTTEGSKTNKKGITKAKFKATGVINRYDYGLTWNELTETGSMVVGKEISIELNVTLENPA